MRREQIVPETLRRLSPLKQPGRTERTFQKIGATDRKRLRVHWNPAILAARERQQREAIFRRRACGR